MILSSSRTDARKHWTQIQTGQESQFPAAPPDADHSTQHGKSDWVPRRHYNSLRPKMDRSGRDGTGKTDKACMFEVMEEASMVFKQQ